MIDTAQSYLPSTASPNSPIVMEVAPIRKGTLQSIVVTHNNRRYAIFYQLKEGESFPTQDIEKFVALHLQEQERQAASSSTAQTICNSHNGYSVRVEKDESFSITSQENGQSETLRFTDTAKAEKAHYDKLEQFVINQSDLTARVAALAQQKLTPDTSKTTDSSTPAAPATSTPIAGSGRAKKETPSLQTVNATNPTLLGSGTALMPNVVLEPAVSPKKATRTSLLKIPHKTNTCYLADFIQLHMADDLDRLQQAARNRDATIDRLIKGLQIPAGLLSESDDPNPYQNDIDRLQKEKAMAKQTLYHSNKQLSLAIEDFLQSLRNNKVDPHDLYDILHAIAPNTFKLTNINQKLDPQEVFNTLMPYFYPRSLMEDTSPYGLQLGEHTDLQTSITLPLPEKLPQEISFSTQLNQALANQKVIKEPDLLVIHLSREHHKGRFTGPVENIPANLPFGKSQYFLEKVSCYCNPTGHYRALKKTDATHYLLDDINGNKSVQKTEFDRLARAEGTTFVFRKHS
ncbi:MAG: hypothetical protein HY069_00450 [Chlamydiia bacterium]|nr:hypothetical protein [Chlamydiia bacterium]